MGAVDRNLAIFYHMLYIMKKMSSLLFPVLFALLTTAFFLLLYHPLLQSLAMTSACLLFLTSLGWSSLIVLGREKICVKLVIAVLTFLASILLIKIIRPFPVDPLQHPLMVFVQGLGLAGIALYRHILKKKGESS
jgi:hypothetical protein